MCELYNAWLEAKAEEAQAVNKRREIEDKLHELIHISDKEGSQTINDGRYKVVITNRVNRRIDSEMLQEIAAENGLTDHLSSLFRWKPDINMTAWKNTDESITRELSRAITATAGRPSFAITIKEEKQSWQH